MKRTTAIGTPLFFSLKAGVKPQTQRPCRRPEDTFRCDVYECTLTARACVLRQAKADGSWGHNVQQLRDSHCTSGKCVQGFFIKQSMRGQKIEAPRPRSLAAYWQARKAVQR